MTQAVETEGLDVLLETVQGMSLRAQNWARGTEGRLQGYVLLRNKERVATQNRSEGKKWAGYEGEKAFERMKSRVLGDLTVLRWKGGKEKLYPSLTQANHPDHVHRVSKNKVTIGTTVPWAKRLLKKGTNQFGEPRPGRDFISMGERSRERLVQLLTIYVVKGNRDRNEWRKRP